MARWKATDKSIPYLPSKKYLGPGDTRGSGENYVTAGSQQGRHIWFSSSVKLRFCCQYRHERWRVGKLVTRTFKFCPQKGNWGPRDTRLGGGGGWRHGGVSAEQGTLMSWFIKLKIFRWSYRQKRLHVGKRAMDMFNFCPPVPIPPEAQEGGLPLQSGLNRAGLASYLIFVVFETLCSYYSYT